MRRKRHRHQGIQHRRRGQRREMRAAGRGRRRGRQRRRANEGTGLDRQIHARHPQQGSRVVPPEGRAEPRIDRRDALLPQTAGHLRRRGHPAARLQTEDQANRLPCKSRQPAGHRNPQDRLHRPPPSSCFPASFRRPKAPCWPKWATADSWATSSSTAPCRST